MKEKSPTILQKINSILPVYLQTHSESEESTVKQHGMKETTAMQDTGDFIWYGIHRPKKKNFRQSRLLEQRKV